MNENIYPQISPIPQIFLCVLRASAVLFTEEFSWAVAHHDE
jgi:hypothetical protein